MSWRRTRRQLFGLGLTLGGFMFAGTVGAQGTCAPDAQQLIIYHAGSLTAAFAAVEKLLTQQTGICVLDVAAGSIDAARRVTVGQEPCDIYASADYQDIELLLKPAGYADYDILFAQGGMVLAYTTTSKNAESITAPNSPFTPPTAVPEAAATWYAQLTQPGVTIGGSHPFLDPSGYRADMIFQLTEEHYGLPNLYNTLLAHYSIVKATDALGKTYDYQFIYEHSALAAYNADPTKTYRYVKLPDDINLSDPAENPHYREARVSIPGLRPPYLAAPVRIPGTRVIWGLAVLKTAPHPEAALEFLQLLFSSQAVALQTATGPAPISPPLVSPEDFRHLPGALSSLVHPQGRQR